MTSLFEKIVALSGLCLTACAAQSPSLTAEKPHAEQATVKPGAAVTLTPSLPKSMSVQTFNTVNLNFNEANFAGLMKVNVVPSEGLTIFGGSKERVFNMSTENTHQLSLDVSAETDGLYFLNVFVEANGQARSFSVSVNIGDVTEAMRKSAIPENGTLKDGVRVLEAEETIR